MSVGDWTNVISTALAALAAIFSAFALWQSGKTAREARASAAMLQYVDLSLGHPKESTTEPDEIYEWYVFGALVTAREVLVAYPDDPLWRRQLRQQLRYHAKELKVWPKDEIDNFGPAVAALVREITSEAR